MRSVVGRPFVGGDNRGSQIFHFVEKSYIRLRAPCIGRRVRPFAVPVQRYEASSEQLRHLSSIAEIVGYRDFKRHGLLHRLA